MTEKICPISWKPCIRENCQLWDKTAKGNVHFENLRFKDGCSMVPREYRKLY